MFNKNNQIKLKNTQNFLQSKKLVSELIEESNICEDDIVIEIGGGKGIITEQLVKRCRRLYVIEYDYIINLTGIALILQCRECFQFHEPPREIKVVGGIINSISAHPNNFNLNERKSSHLTLFLT